MLKRTLIAAATAVAVTGSALTAAAPANAAPQGYVEVGNWKGGGQWKGPGRWHKGPKHRNWRRACSPVVRWKWVGRRHGHWQPIVVGWDCHRGRGHHRGHKKWH